MKKTLYCMHFPKILQRKKKLGVERKRETKRGINNKNVKKLVIFETDLCMGNRRVILLFKIFEAEELPQQSFLTLLILSHLIGPLSPRLICYGVLFVL